MRVATRGTFIGGRLHPSTGLGSYRAAQGCRGVMESRAIPLAFKHTERLAAVPSWQRAGDWRASAIKECFPTHSGTLIKMDIGSSDASLEMG